MNNAPLFEESQRFKQWWLLLILIGVNLPFIYGIITQVFGGKSFGSNPMSDTGLIIAACLTLFITLFVLRFRLDTIIKKDGIYVRLFPLQFRFKHIDWNDIDNAYVRQYSPIKEYGGWGLRFGLRGNGTAYNISGNKGLQLEFNDGKKLLIGTQKPDEVSVALLKINRHVS